MSARRAISSKTSHSARASPAGSSTAGVCWTCGHGLDATIANGTSSRSSQVVAGRT